MAARQARVEEQFLAEFALLLADGLAAQLGDLLGDGFEQRAGLVVQGASAWARGVAKDSNRLPSGSSCEDCIFFSPYQALQPVL